MRGGFSPKKEKEQQQEQQQQQQQQKTTKDNKREREREKRKKKKTSRQNVKGRKVFPRLVSDGGVDTSGAASKSPTPRNTTRQGARGEATSLSSVGRTSLVQFTL